MKIHLHHKPNFTLMHEVRIVAKQIRQLPNLVRGGNHKRHRRLQSKDLLPKSSYISRTRYVFHCDVTIYC